MHEDDAGEAVEKLLALVEEINGILNSSAEQKDVDVVDLMSSILQGTLFPAACLIRQDHDMDIIAEEITHHPYIDADGDDVLKGLFRTFQGKVEGMEDSDHSATTLEELYIILSLIYHFGHSTAHSFRKVADMDALEFLSLVLGKKTRHRLERPAVKIMYEVCQLQELTDLNQLGNSFVSNLLDLIEVTTDEADEEYQNDMIRLMLAINAQFMLKNAARRVTPNAVIDQLASRLYLGKSLGESVIFLFNRADSSVVQLLMLKFLIEIFRTPDTQNFFYTNDLRVIMDVILRECRNVEDSEEELQMFHLSLLPYLLRNSSLNGYKLKDVASLVTSFVRSGSMSSSESSPVQADSPITIPSSSFSFMASETKQSVRKQAQKIMNEFRELLFF
ncbi:hypothetical protein HDU76_000121 [Blyttiomyces sp. JEL0837]|nr:hypothetical protein HDU76_000121 [Blyttiomyces sp. JEL0837]